MTTARAIAASIEQAIEHGTLQPGAPIPSIRQQAKLLNVSPGTVAHAYQRLQDRGFITTRQGRGTQVRIRPPLLLRRSISLEPGQHDVSSGNPDPALLPSLTGALLKLDTRPHLYGEPTLNARLVNLAQHQFGQDGIFGERIAVIGGAMDGIERLLNVHTRPGDRVAVEDPGFVMVLDLLHSMGLKTVPIAVDSFGATPASLQEALAERPRACIFVPRAQNPTGAAFDSARATELRTVLESSQKTLVIENDHAGPVAGAGYFSLTPGREHWAVIRTVSKTLGPDLRLAVMTGDEKTVQSVEARQLLGGGWVSNLLQQLVATLWDATDTADLWHKAADLYTHRRNRVIQAMDQLGIVTSGRSGLNVTIPVLNESQAVAELLQRGWLVKAGETYRIDSEPFIRITPAALSELELDRLIGALTATLRPSYRTFTTG